MAELGAADIAALETVPYAALAAAYNKVAPALKAAGKTPAAPHTPTPFIWVTCWKMRSAPKPPAFPFWWAPCLASLPPSMASA